MRGGADRVRVADRLNVAERLAEGRPAAEHTQSYVRACHLVGYQHPDLTAYPAQIHDWYGSEDGLDLHALDADCAQLRAAASVLMEALRMERSQVAVLAAAWTGSGADAAVHFVQRHCETGNSVVTEVRAAAQRCESLRDNLWQLVDSKVATAIAIDERALAAAAGMVGCGRSAHDGGGRSADGRRSGSPTDTALRGRRCSQRLADHDAIDNGRCGGVV